MNTRQQNVKKRWSLMNQSFFLLIVLVLLIFFFNEYLSFQDNVSSNYESVRSEALIEIQNEVDNRVDEINSVKASIQAEMYDTLEEKVREVDFFASQVVLNLGETATLEEKRDAYIETIYQYDISEEKYLFFAMDLDGVSYLSGLTKNLEGTNITYLQDAITGEFFVLDMIDIIEESENHQGFITYNWLYEVGGEHLPKTSFLYYNDQVELFTGTGVYDIDYVNEVKEDLFIRVSSYYNQSTEDYIYLFDYDGEVFYHPFENFGTQELMDIQTIDGESFHQTIVDTLEVEESMFIEYNLLIDGEFNQKTSYVRRIEDWDMYIGRGFVDEDLQDQQRAYIASILPRVILSNLFITFLILSMMFIIKRLINLNFADITKEFTLKNDEIIKASYKDKLTKLYNRNYFDVYTKELENEEYPLGLIMLDANGLKLINDTYGHDIGDSLLQAIANILKAICKEGICLRWGGDEFLMVLKKANHKDMKEKIDEFNRLAKQTKIKSFTLSASLGYAIAKEKIDDKELFETINQAETMMYNNKVFESLSNKRKIIDQILHALYDSSSFEETHSKNVMTYALMIGKQVKLSSNDLARLRLASLMHDVGKIGVPDNLLSKAEALTDAEREEVHKHTEKGFRILSAYPELSEYGNYALTHHEWFNGEGYPQGLKGVNIPYLSRIISVADAYDAMTSERVYKKSKTKEQAIKELIRCKGSQFDPDIVDAFVKTIKQTNNK